MADGSSPKRRWIAVLAGLAWAQAAIGLANAVVPRWLSYGPRIADGVPYRIASWTVLGPVTLAQHLSSDAFVTLLLCPMPAVAVCLFASWGLVQERSRAAVVAVLVSFGLSGLASAACVSVQFHDAVLAEKAFFVLARDAEPSRQDDAVVQRAREFVRRHPDSRWSGEALRMIATAEWDAGHIAEASELWRSFEAGFPDACAPGVAYAELRRALCDERLGQPLRAAVHFKAAVSVIRARKDGIQAWIARDSAARLSALERNRGRLAMADYWNAKSQTFSGVYSIE